VPQHHLSGRNFFAISDHSVRLRRGGRGVCKKVAAGHFKDKNSVKGVTILPAKLSNGPVKQAKSNKTAIVTTKFSLFLSLCYTTLIQQRIHTFRGAVGCAGGRSAARARSSTIHTPPHTPGPHAQGAGKARPNAQQRMHGQKNTDMQDQQQASQRYTRKHGKSLLHPHSCVHLCTRTDTLLLLQHLPQLCLQLAPAVAASFWLNLWLLFCHTGGASSGGDKLCP
jgi:hypothetical protein